MMDGGCYADLNADQTAWLERCSIHVESLDLPDGVWRVTVTQESEVLMRDIAYGSTDDTDEAGRKLAYRAALAYCTGPSAG